MGLCLVKSNDGGTDGSDTVVEEKGKDKVSLSED